MKKILITAIVLVSLILGSLVGSASAAVISPIISVDIYAGSSNPGVVYHYIGGTDWESISPELGYAVLSLVDYEGELYAGTMSTSDPMGGVGRVYRYDGGTSWTLVGDNMDNQVSSLIVYNGNLYAGTAWNGGRLYRYNGSNDWTLVIDYSDWDGFRSAYVWSDCYLHLGDIGLDKFGRYDGENFYYDQYLGGSCIYDFESYKGYLYGSAYLGRLHESLDGIYWTPVIDYQDGNMWELEVFQDYLYMGLNDGQLQTYNGTTKEVVWTAPDGIISMVAIEDNLFFGTGGEAGGYYGSETSGISRIYSYDGTGEPELISNDLGQGIQVLYVSEIVPDLGFRANPNGFKFENFETSRTWEMFEQFFGEDATMLSGGIRRHSAERYFDEYYSRQSYSCDGFAGTSLINFKHLDQPNAGFFAMPYYDTLYLQDLNDDIEDAIAYQQGFKASLEPLSHITALKEESNNSPKFFYGRIKEAIQNKEPVVLWIWEEPKWWEIWKEGGGHALVPYRYEELSEDKAYVYVYDSNYPGDNSRKVTFDLKNDKWSYKFIKGWWIFSVTWDADAYVSYQSIATVPLLMRLHKGIPPWAQEVSPYVYICSFGNTVIPLFSDIEDRRIGFANGQFINEVPGATYFMPPVQNQDKVSGLYYLPEENDYTVTISGTDEGMTRFSAFGSDSLVEITDATVHPTTVDNISIGRGSKSLTYSTNDDYKEYSATITQELPETSRIATVNTNISIGDIITLEITDEQTFKYANTGDTKTYDLLLEQKGVGAGQILFSDLTIEANDTHIIEIVDWNDLKNTAVNAKIDQDSDGTIDRIERLQVIPRQLKEEVKINLEAAKTGHKIIDKEINLIIKHIEKSLKDKFWIDDFHLDPRYGKEVFHEEFVVGVHMEYKVKVFEKIIPRLEKIIERKQKRGLDTSREESKLRAIKLILPVFKQAVYDLAKADEKLAEVAISDAKNTPIKNPKFQKIVNHQIKKAEQELSKAKKELARNRTSKAIMRFGKAWIHTQLAIKFATFGKN